MRTYDIRVALASRSGRGRPRPQVRWPRWTVKREAIRALRRDLRRYPGSSGSVYLVDHTRLRHGEPKRTLLYQCHSRRDDDGRVVLTVEEL